MVALLLALGVWLLAISSAAFFVVRNLPQEEMMIRVPQKEAMLVPMPDHEFLHRLDALMKHYAVHKTTKKKVPAKVRKKIKLDNMLPLSKSFYLYNPIKGEGTFARSLEEFLETLKEAPQEVFDFHLREDVNDFESWVRNIVKDVKFADALKKLKEEGLEREEVIKLIDKKLNEHRKMAQIELRSPYL
jgi:hypothetical protein